MFFTKVEPEVNSQTVQVSLFLLFHLFGDVVLGASVLVGTACVNSFMTLAYQRGLNVGSTAFFSQAAVGRQLPYVDRRCFRLLS